MKLIKLTTIGLLGLWLSACNGEHSHTTSLESDVDQFSYGLGLQLGKNLKQQAVEMNPDAIAQGLKDALAGAQLIDDAKIQVAAQQVRQRHMDKLKALSEGNAEKSIAFMAENGKRAGVTTTESGLQYEVIQGTSNPEAAKPALSDTVKVHYHGTLIDGSVFDSSIERGEPAQFPLGAVIKGWQEALQLMKVGDKWKLYIPADIAYGARSPSPKIPANSALVFEVELLEIVKS